MLPSSFAAYRSQINALRDVEFGPKLHPSSPSRSLAVASQRHVCSRLSSR
jgi:hypothetical protein